MISYRHRLGPRTCVVGGVISHSSKKFMYPSGEKIALGLHLRSSSPSATFNLHRTLLASAKQIESFALLTMSIESNRSIPSPEKPSETTVFPCTEHLVSSHPPVTNKRTTIYQSPTASPSHLYVKRSQAILADVFQPLNGSIFGKQSAPSDDHADAILSQAQPHPPFRTLVSPQGPCSETDSASHLGESTPGNKLNKKDCIEPLCSSDWSGSSLRLHHKTCGKRIMNEGEEKDFWNKEKVNNDNSRTGSVPGDEAGSVGSCGSLHASDTSEDSHGIQSTCTKKDQCDSGGNPSSTLLFLGPVGKKRKYCRDRQKSRDTEQELPSPVSLPPPTPMGDSDKDLSSIEAAGTSDLDEGQGQLSSRRSIYRSGREELSSVATITSTPTPVIRSVPPRHREEQPLNLSLPSPSEPQATFIRSPGRKSESVHVSVISLAPRERDEEPDSSFQNISSPSLGFYSNRSPRGSSGELTPGGAPLSPVPSTSRGFHSISSGADSSNTVPSTFQGLLVAHGIVSPSGERSPLKKKLQCRDCGKEFSQLRNYRYHRSRHEGTQQFACTCPVCGKTFNDKGYLSSHLKIHRNAKEYKCEWCEKSFNQRVAYNMHVRIHTGHKPHHCSICPKAFSRKMLLRQHLRTHTGERPYSCEICGKCFADRSNMLLHQRLHSGQRPYKCDVCGKSFSKNHHLKTHLNHHAGIKPYQCEKCKACFSQSSNMKTHYRKCSGIPSASSTVTSGSSHRADVSSEHSIANRSDTPLLSSPPAMSRYNISQEDLDEQELHHHHHQQQFIQAQQNYLQQQLASSQQHQQHQLLRSGHHSSSTLGQAAAVQTLGLNLGIMGLSTAAGRSRRNGSVNLLPLGSPSPTSLAAGHPFIPLASLENAVSSGALSPSSSMPPHSVILLSPRNHSNISEANAGFSHLGSLSQHPIQQRTHSSRSRVLQQQQYISQQIHSDVSTDNPVHQLPSPQLLVTPRPSPQRHNPLYRNQSPEPYEILLPALAVSRLNPQAGQQFQQEHFAQQLRPHDLHYQRVGTNNGRDSNRQHGHLLTMARPLSAGATDILSPEDGYQDSPSPPQYSQQDLRRQPSSWRHREVNDDVRQSLKDSRFGNPNS